MRVVAAVVTYNRLELLKRTLEALEGQSRKPDAILVVDNASTDGTQQYLQSLKLDVETRVLRLEENTGGAGGFYHAIKYATCNMEYDWLWLMDDDALPVKNALENLLKAYHEMPEDKRKKVGVLLCEMIDSPDKALEKPLKLKKRIFGMFVGYLIKREIVERIGFPRKEFFIYYDDAEYTSRVRKLGYKVYEVLGSYIVHKDWMRLKRVKKLFFSKPDIPPWKAYYIFRNGMLMFEGNPVVKWAIYGYFWLDMWIWKIVKPDVIPYARLGLKHGARGVSGKVVLPGGEIVESSDIQ